MVVRRLRGFDYEVFGPDSEYAAHAPGACQVVGHPPVQFNHELAPDSPDDATFGLKVALEYIHRGISEKLGNKQVVGILVYVERGALLLDDAVAHDDH